MEEDSRTPSHMALPRCAEGGKYRALSLQARTRMFPTEASVRLLPYSRRHEEAVEDVNVRG